MEGWYFLKWLLKYRQLWKTIQYYFEYFLLKLKKKWLKNRSPFYPNKIRALLPLLPPEKSAHKFGSQLLVASNAKPEAPESIYLASGLQRVVGKCINWREEFDDPEDEESLHRWNWLLHIISQREINRGQILWAGSQLNLWCKEYSYDVTRPKKELVKLLRWESYTVAERLSNSCIFIWASGLELSNSVVESLIGHVLFLSTRLEYFDKQTGNHVINNARGIYLAGVLFDCLSWRLFAEIIFRRELPKFVSEEGLLREGSSHYQFLFSRWILEVLFFAKLCGDNDVHQFLVPYSKILTNGCRFFLVCDSDMDLITMPLLGDISPDFPPEWLTYLPWSVLVKEHDDCSSLKLPDCSWNHIWHNFGNFSRNSI